MELPSAHGHGCEEPDSPVSPMHILGARSCQLVCPAQLLWVLCPASKCQASFSRDSLLACATVSPAFLIPAIGLFSLAVLRLQGTGFIPLHVTSLASSWRGSRLPIFRHPIFGEPGRGLGWQQHGSVLAQSERALGPGWKR